MCSVLSYIPQGVDNTIDVKGIDVDTSESGKGESAMIYNVNESPPIYLCIFFGLQVLV